MKSAAEWGQEYLNTSIKGIDFIRAIQLDAALAQREADAKSVDRALGGSFWAARQAEVDALHAEARYWKDVAEAQREEMQKLRAEVAAAKARLERWNPELQQAKADLARAREALEICAAALKLRAKGSEVPCHRCGLSKMEADKLGVADMTGPQLRLRVLQLEGELADYKAHAWVEMGDYIVVQRQRDALRELARELCVLAPGENEDDLTPKGQALLARARALGVLAKAWEAGRDATIEHAAHQIGSDVGRLLTGLRALQPPGGKAK